MRTLKTILERKDAKEVLELIQNDSNITVKDIAKARKIWYNVAKYLVDELVKADLVEYNYPRAARASRTKKVKTDIFAKLQSNKKDILKELFTANSIVSNKTILDRANVSRVTPPMKADLEILIKAGEIVKEKHGTAVSYRRVK